jgi:hypothetical protein
MKGRQIDVGEEGVARILSHEGIVPIGKESYNPIVATYFIGDEHDTTYRVQDTLLPKQTVGKR